MKQPKTFADALATSAPRRNPPPATTKTRKTTTAAESKATSGRQANRIGKIQVGGYFAPENSRTLKLIALEQSSTVQDLIEEGLRAVFKRYGKEWHE